MRFPDETPLDDVLKYIQQATATPTHAGIPIFVDPNGLLEAERTPSSTVQVDLEDVALKSTLRICLKQLGLGYDVKGGYLRITSEDQISSMDVQDPFLIVGHCLLALLAAGFGAIAATLVAGAKREPSRRTAAADARLTLHVPEDQAGLSAGVRSEEND